MRYARGGADETSAVQGPASPKLVPVQSLAALFPVGEHLAQQVVERPAVVRLLWRPAASALLMILLFWLLPGRASLLAIPLGGALYLALLYLLGALNPEERAIGRRAVPGKR